MEIKDRILRHSRTLFMQRGIKSVSMDDIAADMAMSKKTLYKWFDNKDELVYAVMHQHLGETQGDCDQLQKQATSAIHELFTMIEWTQKQFGGVHPSIFYDMQKFHPGTWQLWVEHKNSYILRQIIENLNRGIKEGLYRPDLDLEVMARLRLGQIEMTFNPDIFPVHRFDMRRLQQVILEHFMLGVATLKGHKLINSYRQVTEAE